MLGQLPRAWSTLRQVPTNRTHRRARPGKSTATLLDLRPPRTLPPNPHTSCTPKAARVPGVDRAGTAGSPGAGPAGPDPALLANGVNKLSLAHLRTALDVQLLSSVIKVLLGGVHIDAALGAATALAT